jgi:arylsulfatase A-like enzyme
MITGFPSDPLVRPISEKSEYGTHTPEGIFLISGPGVAQNKQLNSVHIVDVFPNMLAAWGLPIPESVDGIVYPTIFSDQKDVIYVNDHQAEDDEIHIIDHAHTEEIRDRLRSLGYID